MPIYDDQDDQHERVYEQAHDDARPSLPTDDEVIAAVRDLIKQKHEDMARSAAAGHGYYVDARPAANAIARRLGVRGARRAGNGAVKGSWSGTMSGALRISPRLQSLARQAKLVQGYDPENYRHIYSVPGERWNP